MRWKRRRRMPPRNVRKAAINKIGAIAGPYEGPAIYPARDAGGSRTWTMSALCVSAKRDRAGFRQSASTLCGCPVTPTGRCALDLVGLEYCRLATHASLTAASHVSMPPYVCVTMLAVCLRDWSGVRLDRTFNRQPSGRLFSFLVSASIQRTTISVRIVKAACRLAGFVPATSVNSPRGARSRAVLISAAI